MADQVPQTSSWAAVASRGVPSTLSREAGRTAMPIHPTPEQAPLRTPQTESSPSANRVAFISGHIDLTRAQFLEHYSAALDAAILRGDAFILSNSRGADTFALDYLRSQNVQHSRITVYLHAPRRNHKSNATSDRTRAAAYAADAMKRYNQEGYNTRIIEGYHTDRDAAMTETSDYDILWVRGDAETAALYGSKYRPGRVSGTQKNKERRLLKEQRAIP